MSHEVCAYPDKNNDRRGNGSLDFGPTCRRCSHLRRVPVEKCPDMSEKASYLIPLPLICTRRRICLALVEWKGILNSTSAPVACILLSSSILPPCPLTPSMRCCVW